MPALLYCAYNNLYYVNLTNFDPGTYNVLMTLRTGMTGLLWQCLFSKWLSRNQWAAIALIIAGCTVKEMAKLSSNSALSANLFAWLLMLAQMLSSVLAGVYNEFLLKGAEEPRGGIKITTNLQNGFMYLQSVLWNGAMLAYQGKLTEAVSAQNLATVATPRVVAIILVMSSIGLVTGFFLKHLNSVLKSVAAACEVVVVVVASSIVFGTPINAAAVLAAVLVGAGVAIYNSKPFDLTGRQRALIAAALLGAICFGVIASGAFPPTAVGGAHAPAGGAPSLPLRANAASPADEATSRQHSTQKAGLVQGLNATNSRVAWLRRATAAAKATHAGTYHHHNATAPGATSGKKAHHGRRDAW